ncbi:MAG: hypothetical protein A2Y41_10075 [Spirochaetes bacterium GWB1_36_13]|nr:MAG: hypothetical protein A2Y41_10075 [Spirochaetes bacterium GWB1_36_13]
MVGAVIQARMGSTRLPGKVLKDICGKPLLLHIVERLQKTETLDKIIVATTDGEEDNLLEDFCEKNDICCFRGPSEDVLKRFVLAGEKYALDDMLRVCADSPLIDPKSIDEMILLMQAEEADLVSISPDKTSLLDGFESFRFEFLKKIDSLSLSPYQREHVTLFAKETPNVGKILYYDPPKEICFHDIRITVDTPEDLAFIREVYHWLYEENKIVDIRKIQNLPFHIFRLNQGIRQKPVDPGIQKIHLIVDEPSEKLKNLKILIEKNPQLYLDFLPKEPKEKNSDEFYFKIDE